MTEEGREILTEIAASEARLTGRLNGVTDRLDALQASLARVESKVDFIGTRLLNPNEQKAIGISDPPRGTGSGVMPSLPRAARGTE